jgi:DNA modification methylase
MDTRCEPGAIRDAIRDYLSGSDEASIPEIVAAVSAKIGPVAASSIRSSLNLNAGDALERVSRGRYRIKRRAKESRVNINYETATIGKSKLINANCLDWLSTCSPKSIHAVVTDPPYGLFEYSENEQEKLRAGKGGVWRIPPSFDGCKRSPLPRFTTLGAHDQKEMGFFFRELGALILRVTVPGANVIIASNPLLSHLITSELSVSGLEVRGMIVRLVTTLRGGDRPKNAHLEFPGVSVMPRSRHEPWIVLRHPLDGRVQDNLRRWRTGGFRRISNDLPFSDVIVSNPAGRAERTLAPHPSIKPQAFMRQIVRAALPLGEGVVLDPFAGSGSTLAAANAVGYDSIGVERDKTWFSLAKSAIEPLSRFPVGEKNPSFA